MAEVAPFIDASVFPGMHHEDETIRRRYLELVREFPPERHPTRFAAIRAASVTCTGATWTSC